TRTNAPRWCSAEPRSAPDRGLALLALRPVTAGVRHRREQVRAPLRSGSHMKPRVGGRQVEPAALLVGDSVRGRLVYRKRAGSSVNKCELHGGPEATVLSLNTVCPYYT